MSNRLTASQRYNRRMDKVWTQAIAALQKHCKHEEWYFYEGALGYETMKCKKCGIDENDLREND
jgi:hypothetical protein